MAHGVYSPTDEDESEDNTRRFFRVELFAPDHVGPQNRGMYGEESSFTEEAR